MSSHLQVECYWWQYNLGVGKEDDPITAVDVVGGVATEMFHVVTLTKVFVHQFDTVVVRSLHRLYCIDDLLVSCTKRSDAR